MATQNKYDRQLRLWGSQGQKALSETTVILIRATAAGTETLKNLVLPGIGKIFILDDFTSEDMIYNEEGCSNFFVSPQKNRAQGSMELLQELNPDVQANYKHYDCDGGLLHFDFDLFLKAQQQIQNQNNVLVIGGDIEPTLGKIISQSCSRLSIPLLLVYSYGLIGAVRLQTPSQPLVDPKPDSEVPDLRLVHPLPELQTLASSIQWESLTSQQHGHIPYPFILLQAMEDWKKNKDGKGPQTFQEKNEFRDSIKDASHNLDLELNYQEAISNAYLAYTEKTLDITQLQELQSSIQQEEEKKKKITVSDDNDITTTATTPAMQKFKVLLQALMKLMKQSNGQPPLQGTIPDMTASTDLYVKLQKVYSDQATKNVQEMKHLVDEELTSFTITSNNPIQTIISMQDIETFCKNVFVLDVFHTRTWYEECMESSCPTDIQEDLAMVTFDPYEFKEHTPMLWYFGLRACQIFYEKQGYRYPGTLKGQHDDDLLKLQECIKNVVTKYNLTENELIQQTLLGEEKVYAKEFVRFASAQIHSVASVVGGVASQEAVKLITGQYVPLNNTYVFNGIASTGGAYKF
mmetsp:Transcript_681/g.977  ORF Transcript_681/g.977 Transcript_681/m.977 type:complete len:576 (-) Transcript_681:4491-6218(-)